LVSWLVLVALVPGVLYAAFGGVSGVHDLGDGLLFSATQLTDLTPVHMDSSSHLVDLLTTAQRPAGVTLLGLFGFVLGNRIRSS
jgi:hypothetical protein